MIPFFYVLDEVPCTQSRFSTRAYQQSKNRTNNTNTFEKDEMRTFFLIHEILTVVKSWEREAITAVFFFLNGSRPRVGIFQCATVKKSDLLDKNLSASQYPTKWLLNVKYVQYSCFFLSR